MSQLVDIYNRSTKLRASQAKEIPDRTVDFFDRQGNFQEGWTNNQKKGDPTAWTENALGYYDTELTEMVTPDSFVRHENGIPLNQWNPKTKYFVPGRAPGETEIGTGNR
jgi:hypothetical protein